MRKNSSCLLVWQGAVKGVRGDQEEKGDQEDQEDKEDKGDNFSTLIPQNKMDRRLVHIDQGLLAL